MMRQAVLASLAAVIVWFGVSSVGISLAQQPQQAKPLQFEVATIKPGNPPSDPRMGVSRWDMGRRGGQFLITNVPLKEWVEMGLLVSDYALRAPSWIETSKFSLEARMPDFKPGDSNATAAMMKALLIERFGLKWHEELQTVSGYELVTDKKVLLKPASGPMAQYGRHGLMGWGPTSLQGNNMSVSEIAEALGKVVGRPVVDATHIAGRYDFRLEYRPIDDAGVAEARESGVKDVDSLPYQSTAYRELMHAFVGILKIVRLFAMSQFSLAEMGSC